MVEGTRFAWITNDSLPRSSAEWDREILRSERFVAVPSAGALAPGWTLVVPRRPLLNLSETNLAERVELAAIAIKVADTLSKTGKEVFCFEHGSRKPGGLVGCGVDQAHLHIVPLPFDLIEAVTSAADSGIEWEAPVASTTPFDQPPVEGDYILLWRMTDHQTMVGKMRRPESQWVRRIIASELGIGPEWNYRTHPQRHNVRETLTMLGELRFNTTR
ncbi:HIT family protein [Sphingomonas jatrophae]|uniref:HIT domain-containing protein n=1 Tax=Sphingomonas jatrophae TaxID=1166337 RepID=A0A1I6L170_9SPHN|nr:HIT domain-containing protein [Sphingomonas jatrophae]SFR97182.1 HIT domain-containing protein [Sphingomonas jatrophae]